MIVLSKEIYDSLSREETMYLLKHLGYDAYYLGMLVSPEYHIKFNTFGNDKNICLMFRSKKQPENGGEIWTFENSLSSEDELDFILELTRIRREEKLNSVGI